LNQKVSLTSILGWY